MKPELALWVEMKRLAPANTNVDQPTYRELAILNTAIRLAKSEQKEAVKDTLRDKTDAA